MKQSYLRFLLPKRLPENSSASTTYFGASQFKDLVSKACSNMPAVPESFFHFRNGQPIPDSSPDIRFIGGKGWVGILSVSGDTDALMAVCGPATLALSTHIGQPVPVEMVSPEFAMQETPFAWRYYFRDVACRKANHWKGTDEALITNMVIKMLQRERDQHGFDFPGIDLTDNTFAGPREAQASDAKFLQERLDIKIHDCDALGLRLTFCDGPTNRYARLLRGSFSMNAKLSGIWQAGNLQSRGYGRIILATGADHGCY